MSAKDETPVASVVWLDDEPLPRLTADLVRQMEVGPYSNEVIARKLLIA